MKIEFLNLADQYHELKDEIAVVTARFFAHHRYILGPEVEAFEQEFATYCGTKYCVGVGNGLDAIRLSLAALDLKDGDEVIVPNHTFIATWLAVTDLGAKPVPAAVDPRTLTLDPKSVSERITSRTRAIIPVHLYGQTATMDTLQEVAATSNIAIVEDSAQAHGARFKGRRAGSFGTTAAFSFYPTKNLGAFGDGGAITTNDHDLAQKLRSLRNYGESRKYHNVYRGVNSRLDELQAAFLRMNLKHLDAWNERRSKVAALYQQGLTGVPQITLPGIGDHRTHVWHLYVIQSKRRDALKDYLHAQGIGTAIHYPVPVHAQPCYEGLISTDPCLHQAEDLSSKVLSLPLSPFTTSDQVEYICKQIRQFWSQH